MLLKKLENIYRETTCHNIYPDFYVNLLYNFIIVNKEQKNKFLNPYHFSYVNNISIEESLTFFLYFTNNLEEQDSVLDIELFFECSNGSCDNRIFLKECELDPGLYECNLCGKEYIYQDIKPFIKAYFKLNDLDFNLLSNDPNSTINILERVSDNLKVKSPSFENIENTCDYVSNEGDNSESAVSFDMLTELNATVDGAIITNALSPYEKLMQRLM
ncbi:hypothetical protein [Peribacillus butanolivorans]